MGSIPAVATRRSCQMTAENAAQGVLAHVEKLSLWIVANDAGQQLVPQNELAIVG